MNSCTFTCNTVIGDDHLFSNLSKRETGVRKGIVVDRSLKQTYTSLIQEFDSLHELAAQEGRKRGVKWYESLERTFAQARSNLEARKLQEIKLNLHDTPALTSLIDKRYILENGDVKAKQNGGSYTKLLADEDVVAEASRWVSKRKTQNQSATYQDFSEYLKTKYNFPAEALLLARQDCKVSAPKKKRKMTHSIQSTLETAAPVAAEDASHHDSTALSMTMNGDMNRLADGGDTTTRLTGDRAAGDNRLRRSTLLQGDGISMNSPSLTYHAGPSLVDVNLMIVQTTQAIDREIRVPYPFFRNHICRPV
eukprot:scaffold424_cov162-Amphora_coffeaeformis.AAC.6